MESRETDARETMTDEEQLFFDIQRFIIDFSSVLQTIHQTQTTDLMIIDLPEDSFVLAALFQHYSQRVDLLQHRFQRLIRSHAQQRRREICQGIETDYPIHSQPIHWQIKSTTIPSNESKTINPFVRYLRAMINAMELYDEILRTTQSTNKTFQILPLFHHIEQQLCNISRHIQRMIEENRHSINRHLRRIETKLKHYDEQMKEKLRLFIERDVRPPVLVIPCPHENKDE